MTTPFKTWTVLAHSDIRLVGDRMMTVVGEIKMPLVHFPRRMTVVGISGGRSIIYSAVALYDGEMQQIESLGAPAFLIVPSERHRLDAGAFKERYPGIQVVAPSGSRDAVNEVAHVDTTSPDFGDPSVRFIEVPGTKGTEAALEVTSADGLTLIVNEIIGDIHDTNGLHGWLLKLMGFAGEEPHVPEPVKMQFAKGKAELAAQLRKWADAPNLNRIIVSHGDIIQENPQGVLRTLADSLDT